jgi:hypothetical protein
MANVPHFFEKSASVQELGGSITTGNNYTSRYNYDKK